MKRILLFVACLATALFAHAQSNEITLVVSGEGPNKTDATAIALRSAIEQAYGTFVSANTEILNDEIVRDEIATVASGNIKSYKEISSVKIPDGYNVTVQAVVSIGKLIEYSKSRGSSAEFAGQTFAMNIKMRKLNKENEARALENLLKELTMISKDMFDFSVEVNGEPKKWTGYYYKYDRETLVETYLVRVTVKYISNKATSMFYNTLKNTLLALSLTKQEEEDYKRLGEHFYPIDIAPAKGSIPVCDVGDKNRFRQYVSPYYSDIFYASLRNNPYVFLDKLSTMIHNAIYRNVVLELNGCELSYVYNLMSYDDFTNHNYRARYIFNFGYGIGLEPLNGEDRSFVGAETIPFLKTKVIYDISYLESRVLDLIIGGFNKFIISGNVLYELSFDVPVKEEDLMNLTGFSVYGKERPRPQSTKKMSQNTVTESADEEIYQTVEHMPSFPGGVEKLMEYMSKNLNYPQTAVDAGIQGRVFIGFVVEPDGSVSNVKVLRGIGSGCDEEAVRVISSLPRWEPGKKDGKAVRVGYQIPVFFKLN